MLTKQHIAKRQACGWIS